MSEHAFEYLDRNRLIKMKGIGIGLFLLVETLIFAYSTNETLLAIGVVVGFALPLVYFIANERKIKKTGVLLIGRERIVFGVFDKTEVIGIPEITQYRVSHYNGVALTLTLRDGKKFRLMANGIFCDSSKFKRACDDIEKALWASLSANPTHKKLIK